MALPPFRHLVDERDPWTVGLLWSLMQCGWTFYYREPHSFGWSVGMVLMAIAGRLYVGWRNR
jgi:hypothetical protein